MGRTRALAVLAVAAVAATSGCWPAPGQGPERRSHNEVETGFDATTVADFVERWSASLGDPPGGRGGGHPVTSADGKVAVTSTTGVHAFDGASGAPLWEKRPVTPLSYAAIDTDASLWRGGLYVSLRRHNAAGAREVWEPAHFSLDDGFWYTAESDGRLEAFREVPGGEVLPIVSQFGLAPGTTPTSQVVAHMFRDFRVLLTDTPGASRVTVGVDRVFHAGVGVGTAPGNGVRSYPVDGGPGWVTPVDGTAGTSPVLSADLATVYVGTDAGTVYALATADGSVRWSAPVGSPVTAAPALADGTLHVPTASGRLVAVAAGGCGAPVCAPTWSTAAEAPIGVQPAVAAGVVFTGHDDGTVAAHDAATGEPRWSTDAGSRITGAPAVAFGRLYVATAAGTLHSYGRP